MKKIIKVEKQDTPIRLDKYLTTQLEEFSREKIISFIKTGVIVIKGEKNTKPSHRLKGGETIILDLFFLDKIKEDLLLKPISLSPEPKILYEDKNIFVFDKPAGLVVHPSETTLGRPSLAAWLIGKYPFLNSVGEDRLRPGIVHRLDKDTSGVLIVAKNNPTFFYLKGLFKKREIHKKYLALVVGEVMRAKGTIEHSIIRSRRGPFQRRVVYSRDEKAGKTAFTEYKVKQRYQGYTLLEIIPRTGRTHQIRVHLASLGFPVCGDCLYKKKKKEDLKLSRHFLHAQEISFLLPQGELLQVEAPLPEELSNILKRLTPK